LEPEHKSEEHYVIDYAMLRAQREAQGVSSDLIEEEIAELKAARSGKQAEGQDRGKGVILRPLFSQPSRK